MRYIESEWLKGRVHNVTLVNGALHGCIDKLDIHEAPSIDIVRCGECMHNGSYDTDCPFGWRNGEWNLPKPCDFCSYGELMKGADDD